MTKPEIKRALWDRIHSIAVTIDPIQLIGIATVENDERPMSKSERQCAVNEYRKIRKELLKKSKKRDE